MRESLSQIRQSIALAQAHEAQTHALQAYLKAALPRLHKAIELPSSDPCGALLNFVENYILQVPDVLEALVKTLQDTGTLSKCEVFVKIAEDFFLKPPEIAQHHTGLHALIDEAYLAHRLIEEVNDRLLLVSGRPLIPIDLTLANIVVHDLLGEDFANQLDMAVHYAIEAIFASHTTDLADVFTNAGRAPSESWAELFRRWPALAEPSNVQLKLGFGETPCVH